MADSVSPSRCDVEEELLKIAEGLLNNRIGVTTAAIRLQQIAPSTRSETVSVARIREAIANDRCDGESELARGISVAREKHLAIIDAITNAAPQGNQGSGTPTGVTPAGAASLDNPDPERRTTDKNTTTEGVNPQQDQVNSSTDKGDTPRSPDNVGRSDRWEDPRDIIGGEADSSSETKDAETGTGGTEKLLRELLDRGYKMHVMAGTTTYLSTQDADQSDPLLAWLSDVRLVLYGKTKPVPEISDVK